MELKWEQLKKFWRKSTFLNRLWVAGLLFLFFLTQVRFILGKDSTQGVRMIVAKRQLEPGLVLSLHDLTVQLTSQEKLASLSGYSDSDIHEVVGKKVIEVIKKGEGITAQQIAIPENFKFATRIPKGTRAFTIVTTQQSPLEPGDRVDILAQVSMELSKNKLFFENKKVLAVRNQDPGQEVIIALTPEEATHIQAQEPIIDWQIMLRNPDDVSLKRTEAHFSSRPSFKRKIEILNEVSL